MKLSTMFVGFAPHHDSDHAECLSAEKCHHRSNSTLSDCPVYAIFVMSDDLGLRDTT